MDFRHWVPYDTSDLGAQEGEFVSSAERNPSDGGFYEGYVNPRCSNLEKMLHRHGIRSYVTQITYEEAGEPLQAFSRLIVIIAKSQLKQARQILEPGPEHPIEDFIPRS